MDLFYVLLILLVVTRAFGELAERLRQPSLVGELIAGIGGFTERAYFQAEPGSEEAPEVEFDFGRKK